MFGFCLDFVEFLIPESDEDLAFTLHYYIAVVRLIILIHYDGVGQQAFHVDLSRQLDQHIKVVLCHGLKAGEVHQELRQLSLFRDLSVLWMDEQQLIDALSPDEVLLLLFFLEPGLFIFIQHYTN